MTPPATNNPRQLVAESHWLPRIPASIAPSGTQTMVAVTAIGRCARGTNSAASVAALGMAPPSPIPARNRSAASVEMSSTAAMASVIAPNTAMLASSARRRPIRSPAIPASAPPTIIPAMPSDTTGAKADRVTSHSCIIVGITTPSS